MATTKEKVWLYADTENCDIVIDSFEIANHVGCQHKRVMDRIDSYVRNHPDESCHFILSRHEICKNRFCKAYSLTREGLRIYLQLRDEDAGRNSPKTIRGWMKSESCCRTGSRRGKTGIKLGGIRLRRPGRR